MSLGSTSIEDLPVTSESNNNPVQLDNNNTVGNSIGNVQNIKMQSYGEQLNQERKNSVNMQQMDYTSEISTVLKDTVDSNPSVTSLPSRDIPQNTLPIHSDEEIKQNYIKNNDSDYIGNMISRDEIIRRNKQKENKKDNLEFIYEQIQIPLLIGILYFLFQLPAVRKNMFYFIPALFNKDGNPNFYGYLFNSFVFALIFFAIQKMIDYIQ